MGLISGLGEVKGEGVCQEHMSWVDVRFMREV